MTSNDWYDNKELYEMINDLKIQLLETTRLIKGYNGLKERQINFENKQEEMNDRIKTIENCLSARQENKKDYQWILGWLIGLAGLLYGIFK